MSLHTRPFVSEHPTTVYKYPFKINRTFRGIIKLYDKISVFDAVGDVIGYQCLVLILDKVERPHAFGHVIQIMDKGIHDRISDPIGIVDRLYIIDILKKKVQYMSCMNYKPNTLKLCDQKLDELLQEEATERFYKRVSRRIIYAWRMALANPYTQFGRNRLIREFTELASCNSP